MVQTASWWVPSLAALRANSASQARRLRGRCSGCTAAASRPILCSTDEVLLARAWHKPRSSERALRTGSKSSRNCSGRSGSVDVSLSMQTPASQSYGRPCGGGRGTTGLTLWSSPSRSSSSKSLQWGRCGMSSGWLTCTGLRLRLWLSSAMEGKPWMRKSAPGDQSLHPAVHSLSSALWKALEVHEAPFMRRWVTRAPAWTFASASTLTDLQRPTSGQQMVRRRSRQGNCWRMTVPNAKLVAARPGQNPLAG
mmetsp:Transcript_12020/g.32739  ORF Transcript_12020/g.32739 Transcript_12020/m.32739 type:complete len:252 (+) Transcript_12020:3-758(+)